MSKGNPTTRPEMPAAVPARKSSIGSSLCSAATMSTIYQRCGSHGSATWWRTIFVAWRGQSRHQVSGIDGPHVPRGFSRLAHRRGNLLSSPNSESMDHLARQSGLPNQSSFQLMAAAALYLHNVSLGGKASACYPCVHCLLVDLSATVVPADSEALSPSCSRDFVPSTARTVPRRCASQNAVRFHPRCRSRSAGG